MGFYRVNIFKGYLNESGGDLLGCASVSSGEGDKLKRGN